MEKLILSSSGWSLICSFWTNEWRTKQYLMWGAWFVCHRTNNLSSSFLFLFWHMNRLLNGLLTHQIKFLISLYCYKSRGLLFKGPGFLLFTQAQSVFGDTWTNIPLAYQWCPTSSSNLYLGRCCNITTLIHSTVRRVIKFCVLVL